MMGLSPDFMKPLCTDMKLLSNFFGLTIPEIYLVEHNLLLLFTGTRQLFDCSFRSAQSVHVCCCITTHRTIGAAINRGVPRRIIPGSNQHTT
jgi:hypothetical protein